MKFTSNQIETLERLWQHRGKRVLVITSAYEANVAEAAKREAIGIGFNASALRGLAKKEVIEADFFWKGAWVTVPQWDMTLEQFVKDMAKYGK